MGRKKRADATEGRARGGALGGAAGGAAGGAPSGAASGEKETKHLFDRLIKRSTTGQRWTRRSRRTARGSGP